MAGQGENRVLTRKGAREVTQEEISQITGGTICTFSEDNCTFIVTHPAGTTDVKPD